MKIENIDTMERLIEIRKNLKAGLNALKTTICGIAVEAYEPKYGKFIRVGESGISQEDFIPVFEAQLKKVEQQIEEIC